MTDGARGPGRDRGCESEWESEPECEPCRGQCRDWQKTPNLYRTLPGIYRGDPLSQKMLWRVRVVFASTVGSLLAGGWLYQKYLHYVANKEAARKRKALRKLKPKVVNFDHLKVVGPGLGLVPKVKELVNFKENVGSEFEGNNEENALTPKVEELVNLQGSERVISEFKRRMEENDKQFKKAGCETVTSTGFMAEEKQTAVPIITVNHEKVNKYLNVKTVSKPEYLLGVNKKLSSVVKKRFEPNVSLRMDKSESLKKISTAAPKEVVKKELPQDKPKLKTEIGRTGIALEGEKTNPGEKAVLTVFTPGKNGKHVRRRGWR